MTNPVTVNPHTGCWEWQRARNSAGYGSLWRGGQSTLAHRAYYERHVGPVPDGMQLDHLCRVRCCVNPAHLEAVTNTENVRRGKRAKLRLDAALAIRTRRQEWVGSQAAFARAESERYGVSESTIYDVIYRRTWAAPEEHP